MESLILHIYPENVGYGYTIHPDNNEDQSGSGYQATFQKALTSSFAHIQSHIDGEHVHLWVSVPCESEQCDELKAYCTCMAERDCDGVVTQL